MDSGFAASRRPGMTHSHAHRRRRTRNRAPDPVAGAAARLGPALGAARGAASDQEARAADGAARLCLADRDGEDRDLQDLRQYRHEKSLHLSLIHISEPTRLGMISYAV